MNKREQLVAIRLMVNHLLDECERIDQNTDTGRSYRFKAMSESSMKSIKEFVQSDLLRFMVYCITMDGNISYEEVEMLNTVANMSFGLEEVRILSQNVNKVGYMDNIPISFCLVVDADNEIYEESESESSIWEEYYKTFEMVGKLVALSDGNYSVSESVGIDSYLRKMQKYAEDNLLSKNANPTGNKGIKSNNIKDLEISEWYHKFLILLNPQIPPQKASGFIGTEEDNAFLVYGYNDHECGVTFEVIARAYADEYDWTAREPSKDTSFKIRYSEKTGELCTMDQQDPRLETYIKYAKSISENYKHNDDVEKIRQMKDIDPYRYEGNIDDLLVSFHKPGLKDEGIWVRVSGLIGENIHGRLLNEPFADFGIHQGDLVSIRKKIINGKTSLMAII